MQARVDIEAREANDGLSSGFRAALSNYYERRWLVLYLARRQLFAGYQGSFLGVAWAFLTPLLLVVLYTLIFSEIIGIRFRDVEGDNSLNFGLYLYCGLLPFLAFSEALNRSAAMIKSNSQYVKNLVFPTEVLPLSTTLGTLVDKLFGFVVLAGVLLFLEGRLNWTLVLVPVLMGLQMIFVLGLSYIFATLGALVPDIRSTLQAVVRVMFFATPIIWPVSQVPDHLSWVVTINPLAFLVEAYRGIVLEGTLPPLWHTGVFALFSVALLVGGLALFLKVKPRFADLV
ncbi:ABC transporter permease [Rubrobacter indicoceani]|uniref:ABC transporter permease n=1 Tax=Rubrobacter indicoceani TaxID=2051957 RepID=UPI0013C4EEAD|nr:ABC transporter permease [Rubrobacter indicoceani]